MRILIKRIFVGFILIGIIVVITHNIPGRITKMDRNILSEIYYELQLDEVKLKTDYIYQLDLIREVQSMSLEKIRKGSGIPSNQSRELKHALLIGEGECYDRSRFIEKSIRYLGLPVRHLSVFANQNNLRPFKILTSSNVNSHALTEVKTVKGWVLVDSNYEWLALDAHGNPLSFEDLDEGISFLTNNPQTGINFYSRKNLGVYGLYSRHGGFYKPYNSIPDYNLRELIYNF